MSTRKRNITYFDILRVLSIFIVIFAHTSNDGYFLFAKYPNNSLQFWTYLFIAIAVRFPIPIFFGISGALLLGKENESLKDLWSKKILNMFLIYITISLFYYVDKSYFVNGGSRDFSITSFVTTLYDAVHETQLWYICEYITFLICLPFLRAIVKSLETKYYYYMIGVGAFFKLLPIIEYLLWNGEHTLYYSFKITWLISDIIFFPIVGYFLHHIITIDQTKKALLPVWIAYILTVVLTCIATYKLGIAAGEYSESRSQFFFDYTNFISCIALFLTFKYICAKITFSDRLNSFIALLGSLTFGTYLFHFFFLHISSLRQWLYTMQASGLNEFIAAIIYSFVIMVLSYLLSYVLSRIPFVKKLVGF